METPTYLVNGQYVNANGEPVKQPEPEQPEQPEAVEDTTPEPDEQPAPKRRRITSGD